MGPGTRSYPDPIAFDAQVAIAFTPKASHIQANSADWRLDMQNSPIKQFAKPHGTVSLLLIAALGVLVLLPVQKSVVRAEGLQNRPGAIVRVDGMEPEAAPAVPRSRIYESFKALEEASSRQKEPYAPDDIPFCDRGYMRHDATWACIAGGSRLPDALATSGSVRELEVAPLSADQVQELSLRPLTEPEVRDDLATQPSRTASGGENGRSGDAPEPAVRSADASRASSSQAADFEPVPFDGPPEVPGGYFKAETADNRNTPGEDAGGPLDLAMAATQNAGALEKQTRTASSAKAGALSKKIGAMLIVGFHGTRVDDPEVRSLGEKIRTGLVGGVMFLKHNIVSKKQVIALTSYFRQQAGKRPFIISIDQEGGYVQRLTQRVGFQQSPSAEKVGRMSEQSAARIYEAMAMNLREWGFNMNFGPVLDVNVNRNNKIIARYGRSYSVEPGEVARYGKIFVDAHHKAGLLTSVKHFPGHGSSTQDSHKGFVDISHSWTPMELSPFEKLARSRKIDTVMIGHLYLDRFAARGERRLPASLSPEITDGLMRKMLGKQAVAITDDLDMGAIRDNYRFDDAMALAVYAGNDFVLHSNYILKDPKLADRMLNSILQAAIRDPALQRKIEYANERIKQLYNRRLLN